MISSPHRGYSVDVMAIGDAGGGSNFIAAHVSPRHVTYYCNSGAESFDVPLYYQQIARKTKGTRIDLQYHIEAASDLLFGFSGSKATYMSVRGCGGDGRTDPFYSFRIGRQRYDATVFELPPLWYPDFATGFSRRYMIPSNLPPSPDGEYYFAYLVWKLRTHQQLSGLEEKLFLIRFMDQTPSQAREIHDRVWGPKTQIPESCLRYMEMSRKEQRSSRENNVYELPAGWLDALIDEGAFTRQWADWVGLVPVDSPSSLTSGDDGLRSPAPQPEPTTYPHPVPESFQDIEGGPHMLFPGGCGSGDSGGQQAGPNIYFLKDLSGAPQTKTQLETPPRFPIRVLNPKYQFQGIPNLATPNLKTMFLDEAALDVLERADPDSLESFWDNLSPAGRSVIENTIKMLEEIDESEISSSATAEPCALFSWFESMRRRRHGKLEEELGRASSSTPAAASAAPSTNPWRNPRTRDSKLAPRVKRLVTEKGHAYIKGDKYDEMIKRFQDEESLIQAIDEGILAFQNAGCVAGGTNSFVLPLSLLALDAAGTPLQRSPPPSTPSRPPPRLEPKSHCQKTNRQRQPVNLQSAPPGSPKGPAPAAPSLSRGRKQEEVVLANALRELNALILPPLAVTRDEEPPPASARIIAAKRIRPLGAGAGAGPEYIQPEFATFNRQRAPMTSFGTYGIDQDTGQQYFSTGEWCVSEASRMWKRVLRQRGVIGKATEDIPHSGWQLVVPPTANGTYVPSPSRPSPLSPSPFHHALSATVSY